MGRIRKKLGKAKRYVLKTVNAAPKSSESANRVASAAKVDDAAKPKPTQMAERQVKKLVLPSDVVKVQSNRAWAITELDRTSILDRYRLPALARMSVDDHRQFTDDLLSLQRMKRLGIDFEMLEFPEMQGKLIYNKVRTVLHDVTAGKDGVYFSGDTAAELNRFMKAHEGKAVHIDSPRLELDEAIYPPSGTALYGHGVQLQGHPDNVEKAIVLDNVSDALVDGFVIAKCSRYGVYVKESMQFQITGNVVTDIPFKGITVMGDNATFSISNNNIVHTGNGGLFFNGDVAQGVIEGNRIENVGGTGNFSGGIVLGSMKANGLDTAFIPWQAWNLTDLLESPHNLVIVDNIVKGSAANGLYSHAGYCNYLLSNHFEANNKEGMCLDFGSCGYYVANNLIKRNGGRFNMSQQELEEDFIQDFGILPDGSSPAKVPGISMDNAAYNILYQNIVTENYGSGIKAVRAGLRNVLLCNEVSDNNLGANDIHHFYGIEFASDFKPDYEAEEVHELDFAPCFESVIARNTISGAHFSGIFLGVDSYINDVFDNTIIGAPRDIECISNKLNAIVNNFAILGS